MLGSDSALAAAFNLVVERNPELIGVVLLSLRVSLTATGIAFVIGSVLGAALAVFHFPGRVPVLVIVNALLGLPPVVAGLFETPSWEMEGDVMGLFQFIKDAGSKLFGGSAQAATPDALKQTVQSHGFDAGKLNINMDGDKVKLSGQAKTQEEAEKIILSLGNTVGVAEVDTSDLQSSSEKKLSHWSRL